MALLLKKLQELHTYGPKPYCCGICSQVKGITVQERVYMSHLMQLWPDSSGHVGYPVPTSRTCSSPKAAETKFLQSNTKQMWDRNTEHGQLRWELLEWLIEELQK